MSPISSSLIERVEDFGVDEANYLVGMELSQSWDWVLFVNKSVNQITDLIFIVKFLLDEIYF